MNYDCALGQASPADMNQIPGAVAVCACVEVVQGGVVEFEAKGTRRTQYSYGVARGNDPNVGSAQETTPLSHASAHLKKCIYGAP